MKYRILTSLLLLSSPLMAATVQLDLGPRADVAKLFSAPNCLSNCAIPQPSLEQTVGHWLNMAVQRDRYPQGRVNVFASGDRIQAQFDGVDADYGQIVQTYLQTAKIALDEAEKLQKTPAWQPSWRFFLTLGMPLRNHLTVQLLHFPPDTVLNDSQDYLTAATTRRWASLLTLNGMNDNNNALYQSIVDIAPIAAPASAGTSLKDVYGVFTPYSTQLLAQWTAPAPGQNAVRPVVALGEPARTWLAGQYGLGSFNVLSLARVNFGSSQQVPVLGGNHPSAIWYASNDKAGLAIMQQDLTVACWQAGMGKSASADPKAMLSSCAQSWQNNAKQVCSLYYATVKNQSPADAAKSCASVKDMLKTSKRARR